MMMRGAVAAQQLGIFPRYVDQMYRFMWAEPRKMDDPAIVTAAWKESGFDAEKLARADPGPGGEGQARRQHAEVGRARRFGSPTFFVGDEIFFGKDRLREVEEMIVENKAA